MGGKIVVGTDASGPSRASIDWAIARADSLDMAVELIYVIDERWLGIDVAQDVEVRDVAEQVIKTEIARARPLAQQAIVTGRIVSGRPTQALMDAAVDADLLVIGTHKTGFTYGRAFGSRFLSLASLSPCVVAIVPEFADRARHGVIAAADERVSGSHVLGFAVDEAVRTGQDLVLVSAWDAASLAGRGIDRRALTLMEATSAARDRDPRVTVRSHISNSTMAGALVTASATASVLVVAKPSGSPDDPALAIDHDVLANIASPVIIVGRSAESLL